MVGIYTRCFRYHKGTDFQANHNKAAKAASKSTCCFRYHKGTDFQANHNRLVAFLHVTIVVLDTTKVQIFKQITTLTYKVYNDKGCFRYHKGTDFQANHN